MKKLITTLAVAAVCLAVSIGPVSAQTPRFATADLAGRWQVYAITVTEGGVYSTIFFGTIQFDAAGSILSGSLFYPEQFGAGSVNHGVFRVGVEGDIAGNLSFFDSANNNDLTIIDARMSLDKNIINLIGRQINSGGGTIYGKWTLSRIP
jgi:hypothetical protein